MGLDYGPSYVDFELPAFAHIAQRALNANNHVASLAAEIETAVALSTSLEDSGMQKSATCSAARGTTNPATCSGCQHALQYVCTCDHAVCAKV